MDSIICRYGELALKGKNRCMFEKRLVSNIEDCLKRNNIVGEVTKTYGRMFVFTQDERALLFLKDVFGLVSISPAISVENDIEKISKAVLDFASDFKGKVKSFRITAKRSNKDFEKTSQDLAIILGEKVFEALKIKVNLHNPELEIGVEVHNKTFIFHEKIAGFGGLPLGMSSRAICRVESERDILAAWLFMRRGCSIFPVAFEGSDISVLDKYSYGSKLLVRKINKITDINNLASEFDCKAFVIGDFLDDFEADKYKAIKIPVLTPLIAKDKESIEESFSRIR